jgi:hypothetical protein
MPAMADQARSELLIFGSQVIAGQVWHKEAGDEDANDAADRSDNEGPAHAKIILDGQEDLCADCSAGVTHRRRDSIACASDCSRITLATDKPQHVARSEVAHSKHETVEHDEKRKYGRDLVVCAVDDQVKDEITPETDHHDILVAVDVTQECSDDHAGQSDRAK